MNTNVAKIADNAVITVCRYIRPIAKFNGKIAYSNLGGVTLVYTMDYGKRTVDVRFSICRPNENFNKANGLAYAMAAASDQYDLDKFRALADSVGGFTNAYSNLLNCKYVSGSLTTRETTLYNTLSAM